MTKYHVGIDLHKTVAQVCVRNGRGEIVAERRIGLRTRSDGADCLDALMRWADGGRFAVEAVGSNRWFVNACREAGLEVLVVHAAALDLKKTGRKTDKRDAREISRRLYLGDLDRYARSYFPSDEEFGRRKLLRVRHFQVQRRQQTVNQIRAMLNAYLIRPPKEVLTGKANRAWLRGVELPSEDLTFTLQVLVDDLESLVDQIRRLDQRIATLRAIPEIEALETHLPQVGIQTAATLHCELGDLTRFERSKEVAAYAGVVPRVNQSGEGAGHHGPVTKRGNRELRWILTQWAVRLLAFDPTVKEWARRHQRMPRNKIRLALARRLLVGVYKTCAHGEVFSLPRCLGLAA